MKYKNKNIRGKIHLCREVRILGSVLKGHKLYSLQGRSIIYSAFSSTKLWKIYDEINF